MKQMSSAIKKEQANITAWCLKLACVELSLHVLVIDQLSHFPVKKDTLFQIGAEASFAEGSTCQSILF